MAPATNPDCRLVLANEARRIARGEQRNGDCMLWALAELLSGTNGPTPAGAAMRLCAALLAANAAWSGYCLAACAAAAPSLSDAFADEVLGIAHGRRVEGHTLTWLLASLAAGPEARLAAIRLAAALTRAGTRWTNEPTT